MCSFKNPASTLDELNISLYSSGDLEPPDQNLTLCYFWFLQTRYGMFTCQCSDSDIGPLIGFICDLGGHTLNLNSYCQLGKYFLQKFPTQISLSSLFELYTADI